ncbi:putative transposase-like protein [Trichonephila clavipes]|nr:putative transposase-like protein [Trichonephila clavipes]
MRLMKRNSSDGYIWECRKRGANRHRTRRSVRKNSWFEESELSMIEILKLANMWVRKANRDFIAFELNVAKKTVTDWMSFCREVCMEMCVYESSMLGGPDVIVEIDESMLGKRKYNRGKRVKGTWMFGGIERSMNKFFHVVQDGSKSTLFASIKSNLKEGTTIISDCWKSYDCLEDEGFLHLLHNHKMYFKDSETGAHTNSIQGSWSAIKKSTWNPQKKLVGVKQSEEAVECSWAILPPHSLNIEPQSSDKDNTELTHSKLPRQRKAQPRLILYASAFLHGETSLALELEFVTCQPRVRYLDRREPSGRGNGLVAAIAEWYRYQILACLVTSSSPVPLKTRRVGQRCTLNLSSSCWCGVVVRIRGGSSDVVHVT